MSRNSFDELDKTMVGFATVMALMIAFGAGVNLNEKNWFSMATGIVTALFFVGILFAVLAQRFRSLKDQVEAERRTADSLRANGVAAAPAAPQMPQALKELLDDVVLPAMKEAKEHAHDHDMLQAILNDMGYKDTKPEDDKLPAIEAAFHENTDRYVQLTPDGDKIAVEFSNQPFVPGRSDAHEAARLRGDAARAAEPTKPLTKSQQRRINAQKGYGAITDDELREQRNEARRAKRAAKKAELEAAKEAIGGGQDTNDKPLPGQTKLVE